MPDQSFEQAMAKTHNPIQDNGPTMLSLACDNRKFLVQQDGVILFNRSTDFVPQAVVHPSEYKCMIQPQFGSGKCERPKRHLGGGWLPVLVSFFSEGGITYHQRTFVAPFGEQITAGLPWLNDKPLFVAEFRIENMQSKAANAALKLDFLADVKKGQGAEIQQSDNGILAMSDGGLLAFMRLGDGSSLKLSLNGKSLELTGSMPAMSSTSITIYVPGWEANAEEFNSIPTAIELLPKVEAYWKAVLAPAMQIILPDPLLMDVICASQVHCLIAARNEENGSFVAPWIASMSYGPLESEANSIIRGMAYLGNLEFARRSLEFFIKRYSTEGFLTTGYTLMGTGWHLWTLGEYYRLTQDKAWLEKIAPEVARVCEWICKQRTKTKKLGSHATKVPEYGLMPPGVMADWNAFNYHFCLNGYYYAGLKSAAEALADIGDSRGAKFSKRG